MALARCNFVVQDDDGNIVDGASVEVRSEASGSLVSVYSDRSGSTPLGNPYTAADGADAGFHVAGGAYKITATKAGFAKTWRYVPVGTMQEVDLAGSSPRELLGGDRTYYVRSDGSNSNTGLVNNSGGAFLTIAKAISVIIGLDLNGFNVTIQVGAGTWTASLVISQPWTGAGDVTLQGDTTTPSNVTLSVAGDGIKVSGKASKLSVAGFKLVAGGFGLLADFGGQIRIVGKMEYGACGVAHMLALNQGGISIESATHTISGSSPRHYYAAIQGFISDVAGGTRTVSGTPAFASGFAFAEIGSQIRAHAMTWSGSATGPRYTSLTNSVIFTASSGANFFPGNSAGSVDGSGVYS